MGFLFPCWIIGLIFFFTILAYSREKTLRALQILCVLSGLFLDAAVLP